MTLPLVHFDGYLQPWEGVIEKRRQHALQTAGRLTDQGSISLAEFASGHEYFGLHRTADGWVFRERAPNATACHLIGDFNDWNHTDGDALRRIDQESGIWEILLPADRFKHGDLYRLHMEWPGGEGDRMPTFARRIVQDPETKIFNAQVWQPDSPYAWGPSFRVPARRPPLIYETHIGMAGKSETVNSFTHFTAAILPRIIDAGYNTLQIMALQEHPYYGSFGYHVSNFFALSSRFGTPEEFKAMVDAAHAGGLTVIMDLVHSHAARNEVEGLSRFDGSDHLYFHGSGRGNHDLWDSRLFDYGKIDTLHFLLSNCRFWLDEFRIDGFRFDGVTSMLYYHHGLGKSFVSYDDYFGDALDIDALSYLQLANELIHDLRPDAITIAEDMSGYPGLAAPIPHGGIGFNYRLALGVPDLWTRLTKDVPDEHWSMDQIWHELNNQRSDEQIISYAESHDQALVGDQTMIFRMLGADMYTGMHVDAHSPRIDRGIALHKMIRLITLATAGDGYLNFMGNEFGHPEWIDFPREGNNWSYKHARRQWRLRDDPALKFGKLAEFDRDMLKTISRGHCLKNRHTQLLYIHDADKIICFQRGNLLFLFNFHPSYSHSHFALPNPPHAEYRLALNTDDPLYGGFGNIVSGQTYQRLTPDDRDAHILVYLPARTALVLEARDS